jgi:hypothetical protein
MRSTTVGIPTFRSSVRPSHSSVEPDRSRPQAGRQTYVEPTQRRQEHHEPTPPNDLTDATPQQPNDSHPHTSRSISARAEACSQRVPPATLQQFAVVVRSLCTFRALFGLEHVCRTPEYVDLSVPGAGFEPARSYGPGRLSFARTVQRVRTRRLES